MKSAYGADAVDYLTHHTKLLLASGGRKSGSTDTKLLEEVESFITRQVQNGKAAGSVLVVITGDDDYTRSIRQAMNAGMDVEILHPAGQTSANLLATIRGRANVWHHDWLEFLEYWLRTHHDCKGLPPRMELPGSAAPAASAGAAAGGPPPPPPPSRAAGGTGSSDPVAPPGGGAGGGSRPHSAAGTVGSGSGVNSGGGAIKPKNGKGESAKKDGKGKESTPTAGPKDPKGSGSATAAAAGAGGAGGGAGKGAASAPAKGKDGASGGTKGSKGSGAVATEAGPKGSGGVSTAAATAAGGGATGSGRGAAAPPKGGANPSGPKASGAPAAGAAGKGPKATGVAAAGEVVSTVLPLASLPIVKAAPDPEKMLNLVCSCLLEERRDNTEFYNELHAIARESDCKLVVGKDLQETRELVITCTDDDADKTTARRAVQSVRDRLRNFVSSAYEESQDVLRLSQPIFEPVKPTMCMVHGQLFFLLLQRGVQIKRASPEDREMLLACLDAVLKAETEVEKLLGVRLWAPLEDGARPVPVARGVGALLPHAASAVAAVAQSLGARLSVGQLRTLLAASGVPVPPHVLEKSELAELYGRCLVMRL
ncbi:hypothetical protein GPECTOR_261g665 [Gonium pectorale]|uniref:NYN domain-containing protein n=1 Tax=Gonium pectorale TaxID=33097 RepID=A0A150FXC8_GONPE|nr:hypothetical protein GPECTOR_261g665 [Gonium pectorale]|eukprot:KXZ41855.1 hypothetical protein GPECTOR_261g665 [Gonium pectorale]